MAEISLSRGLVALIDDDDIDLVMAFTWSALKARSTYYAVTNRPRPARGTIYLHRLLAGAADGQMVDHANGDGLDNRRKNLRICTRAQNIRNRRKTTNASGFKGVRAVKRSGRFMAVITVNRKVFYLGTYADPAAAASAYDRAAIKWFGEFAATNAAIRAAAA